MGRPRRAVPGVAEQSQHQHQRDGLRQSMHLYGAGFGHEPGRGRSAGRDGVVRGHTLWNRLQWRERRGRGLVHVEPVDGGCSGPVHGESDQRNRAGDGGICRTWNRMVLGRLLTNWNWSFGDGSSSAQRNPVYTYVTGGVFAPSLVAEQQPGRHGGWFRTADCGGVAHGGIHGQPGHRRRALDGRNLFALTWTAAGTGSFPGVGISATVPLESGETRLHIYTNAGDFSPGLVASNNLGVMVECAGPAAICVVGTCSGLVWNGDFETGDFTAWTSGGMMSYAGVFSAPQFVHSGNYGAMLAGTFGFVATLSQTLATTPGADYLLSFWLNNPAGNSVNQLLVSWDGHTVWGVTNFAAPAGPMCKWPSPAAEPAPRCN